MLKIVNIGTQSTRVKAGLEIRNDIKYIPTNKKAKYNRRQYIQVTAK